MVSAHQVPSLSDRPDRPIDICVLQLKRGARHPELEDHRRSASPWKNSVLPWKWSSSVCLWRRRTMRLWSLVGRALMPRQLTVRTSDPDSLGLHGVGAPRVRGRCHVSRASSLTEDPALLHCRTGGSISYSIHAAPCDPAGVGTQNALSGANSSDDRVWVTKRGRDRDRVLHSLEGKRPDRVDPTPPPDRVADSSARAAGSALAGRVRSGPRGAPSGRSPRGSRCPDLGWPR